MQPIEPIQDEEAKHAVVEKKIKTKKDGTDDSITIQKLVWEHSDQLNYFYKNIHAIIKLIKNNEKFQQKYEIYICFNMNLQTLMYNMNVLQQLENGRKLWTP